MNYEHTIYEKRGRIAYVTINRPNSMNALNSRCHVELRHIFEDYRDDPELWVAILTGAGERAFCAGADLKEVADSNALADTVWGGITRDFECFKPLIAAVNGVAFGGGTELVLAADIVVAADTARFGLTEPRVGVIAGAGGLQRLPRLRHVYVAGDPLRRHRGLTLHELPVRRGGVGGGKRPRDPLHVRVDVPAVRPGVRDPLQPLRRRARGRCPNDDGQRR